MKQVELVSTMGTVVSLDVRTSAPPGVFEEAVEAVTARLLAIEDLFSAWRPDSWVSRLIRGGVSPVACPLEVQQVLEVASPSKPANEVEGRGIGELQIVEKDD